jgi:hypothetical protein
MNFPSTVFLEKKISTDASHLTTYETPVPYKCNLQQGFQVIKNTNGEATIISAWIAFPPGTEISVTDRITLPDGSQPSITSVASKINDFTHRVVYIEVFLSKSVPAGSVV